MRAEGAKAALALRAEGEAEGIRAVAMAIKTDGGSQAMSQRIAEQYVVNLGEMSKHAKTIIVPDRPNDLAGVVTTALGVGDSIAKAAAAK